MPEQAPTISDIVKDSRYQALSLERKFAVRDELLGRLQEHEGYKGLSEAGRVEKEARLTELLGLSKQEKGTSLTAEQAQALLREPEEVLVPVGTTTRGGHAAVFEQPVPATPPGTAPFFRAPEQEPFGAPEAGRLVADYSARITELGAKSAAPSDSTNLKVDFNRWHNDLIKTGPEEDTWARPFDPSEIQGGQQLAVSLIAGRKEDFRKQVEAVEFMETAAQMFYKKYKGMSPEKRILAMSKDTGLNLFGIRNWMSRKRAHPGEWGYGLFYPTPGWFEARAQAVQRVRAEGSLGQDIAVAVLSDVPRISAEFLLTGAGLTKVLGQIPAGVGWVKRATRASALFAAHTALQAPYAEEEELSGTEFAKERGKQIVKSGATGFLLGGLSRLVPSSIIRTPAVVGGLSALSYAETYASTGDHELSRRSGLKTAATVLALEMTNVIPAALRQSRQARATAKAYSQKVLEARSLEEQRGAMGRYVEQVRHLAEASQRKAGTTIVEPVRTTESFVPALRAAKSPTEQAEVLKQFREQVRTGKARRKAVREPSPVKTLTQPTVPEIPIKTEYAPKDSFVEGQFRSTTVDGAKVTFGKNAITGKREIRSVTFKPTMSQAERSTWFAEHPMPGQAGEVAQGRADAIEPIAKDATTNIEQIRAKTGLGSRVKIAAARALGPLYPSMVVIQKFGPEIDAELHIAVQSGQAGAELLWQQTRVKGSARWPAKALEHLTKRAAVGRTIDQLQTETYRYSQKTQKNMLLAITEPMIEGAKDRWRAARASLTKRQLRMVDEMAQPVRDMLLEKGREMYPELRKFEAYFQGLFKNAHQKTMLLDSATNKKSTLNFMQQKGIGSPADADFLGFEFVDYNIWANLRRTGSAYYYHHAMEGFQKLLYERGSGTVIRPRKGPGEPTPQEMASGEWKVIGKGQYQEPAFAKDYVQKDVAKVLNNRIATNLLSQSKVGRVAQFGYRTAQQLKFLGSLFHRGLIFGEDISIGRLGRPGNPMNWVRAVRNQFVGISKAQLKDPVYEKYLSIAGSQSTTMEGDVVRVADNLLNTLGGPHLRALFAPVRAGAAILRMGNPQLFKKVIPRIKFEKFRKEYYNHLERTGREPTKGEQVEMVKETQNILGMMNEGLFGMSGTAISLQRLAATAPGFYRGNVQTELKGVVQFPFSLGRKGKLSAVNLVQSYGALAIFAGVVRTLYEGEVPEFPRNMQELRDFVKLRTGEVDEDGREVMLDLIKHQRDYWEDIYRPIMLTADGKIDRVPEYMVDRLLARTRTMTAPLAKVAGDAISLWQKGAVYDWKNNRVFYPTDPLLRRMSKLLGHEWTHFEPIPLSVLRRSAKVMSLSSVESLMIAVLGLRPTLSDEELEVNKLAKKVWSFREQQRDLYSDLGKAEHPREAIDEYNEMIDGIYGDERMSSEFKKKLKLDKHSLHIDTDKLLANKVFQFTSPNTDEATQKKIRAYMNNFDAGDYSQMRKHLRQYKRSHPTMKQSTIDERMDRLRRRSRLTQ